LSHFWEECDALAHENIFFNLWRFLSHPSRKTSHFGPAGTNLFWTGRNVTIRLGWKHVFLFPSQIWYLSRKREAGRPSGLRPTLRAGPPEMPLGNWYNCGTKHFQQTKRIGRTMQKNPRGTPCTILHPQAWYTPFSKTLTAKWSWYCHGCGYH